MGGRRKDFDGAFAMLDTNFILDDPRIISLPVSARWVYLCLWCLAVRTRHSTIPAYEVDAVSIARRTGFRPYLVSTSYLLLEKVPTRYRVDPEQTASRQRVETKAGLIKCNIDGTITVFGVQEKHPNLKWKKPYKLIYAPLLEKEEEKEKEKEEEDSPSINSNVFQKEPYNHPYLQNDQDYKDVAVMYIQAREDRKGLTPEQELTAQAAMVWAFYKSKVRGGQKFQSAEDTIKGCLLDKYGLEDIQKVINEFKGSNRAPIWKVLKPLEKKTKQVHKRTYEEEVEHTHKILAEDESCQT